MSHWVNRYLDTCAAAKMSSQSTRRSVEERTRGNKLYQEAIKSDVPTWTKQQLLQQCFPFYQRAFQFAKNNDEKASAKKNIGLAYRQMANSFSFARAEVGRLSYFMVQAIESFSTASYWGKSCKTDQWISDIYHNVESCIEIVQSTAVSVSDLKEKLLLLRRIAKAAPEGLTKATCFLKLGEATFNAGVIAYESQLFSDCLGYMADCHEPFEEALRLGRDDPKICEEAQDFKERVYVHLCIAESVSLRLQAENLYQSHIRNQECINFDFIWGLADMFKQATMLVREQDLEQEAIGLSRLGKVFDELLKLPDKAKGYYRQSFQLATALFPRTFNTKDWYQNCSQAVERYQKEIVRREEYSWQEQRKPFIEELKPQLDDLTKAFDKGYVMLLKHIYSVHPPKNPQHTMIDGGKTKKAVKMSLLHYHTDKLKKEDDMKWYVLCEEICKLLTQKYELLKGED